MNRILLTLCLILCGLSFLYSQIITAEFLGIDESEYFGSAVSLSEDGDLLAIAANNYGENQGRIQTYEYKGGVWSMRGESIVGLENASLGGRIILSPDGNKIMVKSLVPGESSGQVEVFEWDESTWAPLGQILKNDQPLDLFGDGLAFSGDGTRIAIGSPQEHGPLETQVGSVRVFEQENGVWQQIGSKLQGTNQWDYMGAAVDLSLDGNRLALSVHGLNSDGIDGNGAIRIYEFDGSDWNQLGSEITGTQEKAKIGRTSVKLSADGNRVAFSGDWYGENGERFWGIVEVYEYDGEDWTSIVSIKGESGDWLGTSMDFSDDGKTLVIGSKNNLVRLYKEEGGEWIQKGEDLFHEEVSARFGESLALSGNGQFLVIGAERFDALSKDEGLAQVFDLGELATSSELVFPNDWTLYPNPFRDHLILSESVQVDRIRFFDLYGRLFYELKPSSDLIHVPRHIPGMVYVQIFSENTAVTKKITRM